jgi:UDPglucose 6-dehydrogenase
MSNYHIGICGYGYVGMGMHRMFENWVTAIYSPHLTPEKVLPFENSEVRFEKESFVDVDLVVVSVPTAMKENGQCDTSIVDETIKWLHEVGVKLVVIKSTIEPGTTDRLQKEYPDMDIVFSPEYMGEGKYFTPPWLYPDPVNPVSHGFMVMGGKDEAMEKVAQVFVKKMGPHTKFVFMPAKEAEIVKYLENIWGSQKVIFMNEMYECIKALGGNFYRVREGWAADPRVERMHTAVFERARGFSGKCYPKDLRAFIYAVEKAGYNPQILKLVWNLNAKWHPEYKLVKMEADDEKTDK